MSPINNNASVLAVRIESVEGTPELAASSGDFVALQPGFELTPETDSLENLEIKSTIARAASSPGIERTTGSFDHYVRGSGVEGQAPNWGKFLESVLGGKNVASTEVSTIVGSTTTVLRVASGDGADLFVGAALLIKDPVNGRKVRNIKSITPGGSYDEIELNFALPVAPGTGIPLGLAVTYYGVDKGHKSLTFDLFRGNDGSREVGAGCKVTETTIDVAAAEYINATHSVQGRSYYFDPIKIESDETYLDFSDGSPRVIQIAAKLYKDPYEICEAINVAIADLGLVQTQSVTWNDYGSNKGKFTFTASGGTFSLPWNTGANAANSMGEKLGFLVAADDTGSLTYTSDNEHDWSCAPLAPSYDNADPQVAKSVELLLGSQTDLVNVCIRTMSVSIANEVVERLCASSDTGVDSVGFIRRTTTLELAATLEKHEARFFKSYRLNETMGAMFNFGERFGGSLVAGKTININLDTAKITAINVGDDNGDAILNLTLQAHVENSATREVFLSQV